MKRKKILVLTDSPMLHTGFARVGKEIFTALNRTGKYEIVCVGWFHQNTLEDITYPIWTTKKNEKGAITQADKYGHKSFPGFVDKFKPDLVWTLGDMWMIDHVALAPNRKTFEWVAYFPIDGEPSPSKWGKIVENMDVAVAYGKYGMNVISKKAPKANLRYIYHGVNTEIFKPFDEEVIKKEKKTILGVEENVKIIGIVARNQPRKAFDKLFEAYFYILNGMYLKCNVCNKITVQPYDIVEKKFTSLSECRHCKTKDVKRGKPRDNVRLYLHAAPVDCGWDLMDLQKDFGLHGKVLINPKIKIGVGVSESTLAVIYNIIDIFTLPTRGEGFGLPILEAMACGTPVVATKYSGHVEWADGCGELIEPIVFEAEPLTNIRRAVIDMDLYVTSLIKLLDNKDLCRRYRRNGIIRAKEMDWKIIVKQWEKLIDDILYPNGVASIVGPQELEYTLEEA